MSFVERGKEILENCNERNYKNKFSQRNGLNHTKPNYLLTEIIESPEFRDEILTLPNKLVRTYSRLKRKIIKRRIGFEGLLSDVLASMKLLSKTYNLVLNERVKNEAMEDFKRKVKRCVRYHPDKCEELQVNMVRYAEKGYH